MEYKTIKLEYHILIKKKQPSIVNMQILFFNKYSSIQGVVFCFLQKENENESNHSNTFSIKRFQIFNGWIFKYIQFFFNLIGRIYRIG